MADMSPMAEEDSPSSVIHKRELAEDTDGDALSPQKRPLNNNNNDVATVFLIDASDVNDEHDPHDESAVEVDEVISNIPVSLWLAVLPAAAAALVLDASIQVSRSPVIMTGFLMEAPGSIEALHFRQSPSGLE